MEESAERSNRLIRVLLFAPSTALRTGLRSLLAANPDISISALAAAPQELDASALSKTDVVLAGGLKPGDLQLLIARDMPLVLITSSEDEIHDLAGSRLPGWGLLPEEFSELELSGALQAAAGGLLAGSPGLMEDLLVSRQNASFELGELVEPLTNRELEVLQQMAQGMANKQVALQLGISEHTVKFHLTSIYAKLGVSSRTEAVNAGMRRGLISV